jgi:hypothetical protein
MSRVLSIDLAYTSYAKFGACLIEGVGRPPWRVEFVKPEALGLAGEPRPADCAAALARFAAAEEIDFLLLDGPQGWKDPRLPGASRACDRQLNCPARVGVPGQVVPANYRGFVEFSIDLFTALTRRWGMPLLRRGLRPRAGVVVAESFPHAAWKGLGLPPLPAKSRCSAEKIHHFNELLFWRLDFDPVFTASHDELQAAAAAVAGPALASSREEGFSDHARGYRLVGVDPVPGEGKHYLEGLVVLPAPWKPIGEEPSAAPPEAAVDSLIDPPSD